MSDDRRRLTAICRFAEGGSRVTSPLCTLRVGYARDASAAGATGDFPPSGMLRESRGNEGHEVHLRGLIRWSVVGSQWSSTWVRLSSTIEMNTSSNDG
ncbi:MAG: hypothetical protein ABIG63_10790 [Chloroflexota bacterium]